MSEPGAGTSADLLHMRRALALAARGLYTTDPNPRVGCVVVRDGRVVGEGWHRRAGEPHAEIEALAAAGEAARGATVYVTLEPCAHTGRTPPCTRALVAAGVARVVAAATDPDPRVRGAGLRELAAAGVAVADGVLADEARALNPGFFSRLCRGRPWLRLKLAATLDGRTATATGESRWITGEAARADVHHLRARSSAVLTGIGTVLADDPRLDARVDADVARVDGPGPARVVVDSRLRTPPGARLLALPGRTVVACADGDAAAAARLEAAGATVRRVPDREGRVDLGALLAALATEGANEVTAECGPILAGALLAAGLVDELVLYLAPTLLGDAARGMFHLPGLERMAERVPLEVLEVRAIGADWRFTARPAPR